MTRINVDLSEPVHKKLRDYALGRDVNLDKATDTLLAKALNIKGGK